MLNIEALGHTGFTGIGPALSSLPCASPYFSKSPWPQAYPTQLNLESFSQVLYLSGPLLKDCSLFFFFCDRHLLLFCTAANVIHQCCSKLCCHLDKEVLLASNLAFCTATRWFRKPIVIQFELQRLEFREREREFLRGASNKPKCPIRHTFKFDRIGPNRALFLLWADTKQPLWTLWVSLRRPAWHPHGLT
jgi:hypothetical protein